ncbi:MAG TPA: FecR family protein [Candidatus Lustribacter sp.]
MLVRRLGAGALCFLASVSLVCDRVSSESGDKQLARVKGIVGYQVSATSAFKPIFGRLDLPDDAFAVTKPNAAAVLRLKDSSEIDIGENTKVQVGAFNPAESGNQNTIILNGGALHFNIRHPQGGQSNYRFVTATSQIAVRGTEGFLIAGANGTQVVCVSCAAGDVSVQVGSQTVSIVSNQTLTILGSNPLTATTSITANPTINNPAVNQFNGNQNPFSPNPTSQGVDPTNSFSGSGTGAAGAGASAGAGIGGVVTTVGAAAAAGGVAAAVASSNKGPAPSPPPPSGPGTLVLQLSFPAATTFPFQFTWPFSQLQATGNATFACSPPNVITCTANQQLANGTLNGALSGTLNAAGSFTVGGSASGYTLPTTTLHVFGAVTLMNPASAPISFNQVPSSQQVTVSQAPNGSTLTASINCPGGSTAANVTLSGAAGPSPLTFTVTANSAPNVTGAAQAPPVACTINVAGQGDGPRASLSIPVNVTSTGLGISAHRRRPI